MMNKRILIQTATALLVAVALSPALAQDKPLKIGVTAGPHAQIFEQVKKIAEKDGLKIQIVEFSDHIQPNAALASGDLDANSYQHKPFLDQQIKDRGYAAHAACTTANKTMRCAGCIWQLVTFSRGVDTMRRMKCIGAQFIDVTATTAPPIVVQMQCRRNSGNAEHRTFVSSASMCLPALASMQLPLFEDPPASRHT